MDDDVMMSMDSLIPLLDGETKTEPAPKLDLQGRWQWDDKAGGFVQLPDPPVPRPDPNAPLAWDQIVPQIEAGKPGEIPRDDWTAMIPPICTPGVPKVPSGPPPSAKDPGQVVPDAGGQSVPDAGDGLEVPPFPGGQEGGR